MNTKLIKKENSLSQSKPTSTMSTENENIIFVEHLSNKETTILKFKHFFSSKKAKINNIINSIDKILSDSTHWLAGKPVTPIAKLIECNRDGHHLSTLRLDKSFDIPGVNIGIFNKSIWQSAAPNLPTGTIPNGTNVSFPITKTSRKILDHTKQVSIIKKPRDQMTEVEMNDYSNLITNNHTNLIKIHQVNILSHGKGR